MRTGATARGVTDTEIHVSTMGDPSNTVIPGAGQESFDVADGLRAVVQRRRRHQRPQDRADQARRQAVQHRRSGDQRVPDRLHARRQCQPARRGRRQAATGVQPGADPGLRDARRRPRQAAQQVVIDSSVPQVAVGAWRELAKKYPAAFQAISMITVNGGGLDTFAERQQDALTSIGYKVVNFQEAPVTGVANWRPVRRERQAQTGPRRSSPCRPDISAFVRSMDDIGWKPRRAAARRAELQREHHRAGQGRHPAADLRQHDVLAVRGRRPESRDPARRSPSSSPRASSRPTSRTCRRSTPGCCGRWRRRRAARNLTGACVIAATPAAQKGWTGGGIIAPVDTHVGPGVLSQCFVLLKATAHRLRSRPRRHQAQQGHLQLRPGQRGHGHQHPHGRLTMSSDRSTAGWRSSPAPARTSARAWRWKWPPPERSRTSRRARSTTRPGAIGSLRRTVAEIEAAGGQAIALACDHTDDAQVEAVFDRIRADQGRLDLVVNVASPDFSEMVGVPFWEIPFRHISACLDVGPRSDYVTTALAARMMVPQGSGVVINISSHGAKQHLLSVPYGVGKGAIDKLTQDTATELRAHGVAVVSLWPGLVLTEGLLANVEVAPDGTRTLHGLDISFGETPKFNGRAVVALAVGPEDPGEVRRLVLVEPARPRVRLRRGRRPPAARDRRHPDPDVRRRRPRLLAWRRALRQPT